MSQLPSGTVTFLFTDIEGSTQLLKRFGALYGELLAQHQRIIRTAASEHGGREIDTQGDSFFFAFPRANAALGTAVVAQRALAEHDWPEGGAVRVRMGLHTGEPIVGEERYVGMGVHRAARIGAISHGGQVLLSNATRELVEEDVDGVTVRELGSYRLKDIDRPERLYQLDIEGLPSTFPPLRAERIKESSRVSRRTILVAALAGVLAAAVAIPIFAFGQGGSNGDSIDAAVGNSVAFVDRDSNRLVADVAAGTTPSDVAVGDGAVWVTNAADGTVDRIDPGTRTVRQTIRVGDGPDGVAFGAGFVWVVNGFSGTVSRIDPRSNEVTQTIPVGNGPSGIDVGGRVVWVVNRDDSTVSKIDARSGRVARTSKAGVGPIDVAVGAGGVWVTSSGDGRVLRLDPASGSVVDSVNVGRGPGALAATAEDLWVANSLDGTVSRIDPSSPAVTSTIPVGAAPEAVAATDDAVWVASEQDGSVARIDPAANAVTASISIGARPVGVAIDPTSVFVAARPAAGTHRGGVVTVGYLNEFYPSFDTAVSFNDVLGMTNDGLTAFARTGGRESTQILPDLATSLPEPTDDGRMYTFRLRKGIRYSSGALVRPADFRRALERTFELRGDFAYLYSSVVGATACIRRPRGCDLSRGIVANEDAGTVTFRLQEPDPELLAKLALPPAFAVPARTPSKDAGLRLPATGPYRIASYAEGRQLRLVRNPHFREWSRAARPDGYADEIVLRAALPVAEQVRAVGRGEVDVTDLSARGGPDIAALKARYGARLRSGPGPGVVYTYLNTRLPPFDDVRVRRALNYALDRQAIARTAGGPEVASASCQVLPANFPGYRPYCPWKRDLAKARRLVAASGTRGTPVVVWTRATYRDFYAHVVSALRSLGYPARLEVVAEDDYYSALEKAGPENVQAGYVGWYTAYPSAGDYIGSLLGYLQPATGFSDPDVEREIRRARRVQQRDPHAADQLWANVDRMIFDRALVVPMYNPRWVVLMSERVGNFQYHPLWFTLVDQLWVR